MFIIDDPEYRKVYETALNTWGIPAQKMMAVGECGEFLAEIGREVQRRSSQEKMIDEIADVMVMMNQMAMIYGEDAVRERIKYKIEKVKNKLGM